MKNILVGILILGISLSFTTENGKLPAEKATLSGVITYQEAYASAKQADAGAEIYAVNEADVRSTEYENMASVMGNFQFIKFDHFLSANTVIDPAKIKRAQDNYDNASNLALKYLRGFKKLPTVIKTTANATGNYTLNLMPGRYYILVVSANVKSSNNAESSGNIDFRILNVTSTGGNFLDFNFIRHERIISFAPVPAGC